jgi:hypothetical protein
MLEPGLGERRAGQRVAKIVHGIVHLPRAVRPVVARRRQDAWSSSAMNGYL